jgi:ankyrin repeat protein
MGQYADRLIAALMGDDEPDAVRVVALCSIHEPQALSYLQMPTVGDKIIHGYFRTSPRNPIHISSARGWTGLTGALLDHGISPNTPDHRARAPLCLAAEGGFVDCLHILLAGGARRDAFEPGLRSHWPLAWAALCGDDGSCVKALILNGAHLHKVSSDKGWSAVHYAAASNHGLRALGALIEAGADPCLRSISGRTPLMVAADHGSLDCARLLLSHGALTALGKDHMSASDIARKRGHLGLAADIEATAASRVERIAIRRELQSLGLAAPAPSPLATSKPRL